MSATNICIDLNYCVLQSLNVKDKDLAVGELLIEYQFVYLSLNMPKRLLPLPLICAYVAPMLYRVF